MTPQNYLNRSKKSLSVVVRRCPFLSVVFSQHFVVVRGLSVGCGFLLKTLSKHYVPLSVVVRSDMFCLFSPYTVVRGCP